MKIIDLFNGRTSTLRNKEHGKRIFILANGPSVASMPLSLLKDEVVIGMNASSILDERHDFVSNYHVISDHRFLSSDEKKEWGTTKLHKNTIRVLRKELRAVDDHTITNRTFYVPALTRDGFSKNLSHGFYYGCTTTMLAIQLAWYLGSREIYLLGCDLRYPDENPRFYEEKEPQLEDSFISVQLMNIVNAAKIFENEQGNVFNCSEKSFLMSYLPYVSFKSLFNTSKSPLQRRKRSINH